MNARPVQDVFGPAIDGTRDNAKHVFQRQGSPDPMMGFQLGHRYQEVCLQNGLRKIQLLETGEMTPQWQRSHIVIIEVYIASFGVFEHRIETGSG